MDIVDELSLLATRTSANVSLVSLDSEEGATLANSFGGIAAILRYPGIDHMRELFDPVAKDSQAC